MSHCTTTMLKLRKTARRAGGRVGIAAAALLALGLMSTVNAADYFNGREVYELRCQGCHGIDGASPAPGSPDFSRGDSMHKTDAELFKQIRGGGGAMPAFRGILSDDEIRDVIAYVRSLQQ